MLPVRPILEYGASCWDQYREGQIIAIRRVKKKAAKFTNHTNYSVWETLAKRRKIARICDLFKAYTAERAWKSIGGRLKEPRYLSRDDLDRKIRVRKQSTVIGKFSFVNRTIKLWNQLPAEALATFPVNHILLERRLKR